MFLVNVVKWYVKNRGCIIKLMLRLESIRFWRSVLNGGCKEWYFYK